MFNDHILVMSVLRTEKIPGSLKMVSKNKDQLFVQMPHVQRLGYYSVCEAEQFYMDEVLFKPTDSYKIK